MNHFMTTHEMDMSLSRFKSEKVPLTGSAIRASPLSMFSDKPSSISELNRQDSIDYSPIEKEFDKLLMQDYVKHLSSKFLFYAKDKDPKSKKGKTEDPLLFYTMEVVFSDKNSAKRRTVSSYRSIFDRNSIKEHI